MGRVLVFGSGVSIESMTELVRKNNIENVTVVYPGGAEMDVHVGRSSGYELLEGRLPNDVVLVHPDFGIDQIRQLAEIPKPFDPALLLSCIPEAKAVKPLSDPPKNYITGKKLPHKKRKR